MYQVNSLHSETHQGSHSSYNDTISKILHDEEALERLGINKYDSYSLQTNYNNGSVKWPAKSSLKNRVKASMSMFSLSVGKKSNGKSTTSHWNTNSLDRASFLF